VNDCSGGYSPLNPIVGMKVARKRSCQKKSQRFQGVTVGMNYAIAIRVPRTVGECEDCEDWVKISL